MTITDMKDFIGLGIGGILALLWFDIRKIRKERDEHKEAIKEELEGYLTEEKHVMVCEIKSFKTVDKIMNKVDKKIDDTKDEIVKVIRENNKL